MVNKYLFLGALASAILPLTSADAISDVLTLNKSDFDGTVKPEKLILVEFFAPWCGHCKALAPEYEIAATTLKSQDIKLAKVDCTVETEICEEYGVRGYPTLKVFRDGEPTDYGGLRKADGIVSYMKKQALPALSKIAAAEFEKFTGADKVVVVGYLAETEHKEEHDTLNNVANKLREKYVFGVISDEEHAKKNGITFPSVVIYKTFDEGKNELTGSFTEESLVEFIKTNSVPLLDEIGPENYGNYHESGVPLAYIFVDNENDLTTLVKALEPVAKEFKGKVNFVHIDATKFSSHAQNLNLQEQWPAFAIQDTTDGSKYPFDQSKEITTNNIREFVTKFVAGDIEPSMKSQDIPEKNDEPVKVVVGKQFEDIVFSPEKDVLIEFYAPWCGHCKKLAPIWDELGNIIASDKANSNIVIAKMDATENDLPKSVNFRIEGFPTIKLFRAGDKEIFEYNGDRSLLSLVEFLKENAVNKPIVDIEETAAKEEISLEEDDEDVDFSPEHDEL